MLKLLKYFLPSRYIVVEVPIENNTTLGDHYSSQINLLSKIIIRDTKVLYLLEREKDNFKLYWRSICCKKFGKSFK